MFEPINTPYVVVPGLGDASKPTLDDFGWDQEIVVTVGLNLSSDNNKILGGKICPQGKVFKSNQGFRANRLWPKVHKNLKINLSMKDASIFTFNSGSLIGDYIDCKDLTWHVVETKEYETNTVKTEDYEEKGIQEFCMRPYLIPTSLERAVLWIMLYPTSKIKLASENPLFEKPSFPGLKLTSVEVPFFPLTKQQRGGVLVSPLIPLILLGADGETFPNLPSNSEICDAIASIMRAVIMPDCAKDARSLNNAWKEIKELGTTRLKEELPSHKWPLPSSNTSKQSAIVGDAIKYQSGNASPDEENEGHEKALDVQVKQAKELLLDPDRIYLMSTKKRGLALMINYDKFNPNPFTGASYTNRKGSRVDLHNFDQLFSQLHFEVLKYENLTRNETFRKLLDFSEHPGHISADMAVLCISTHGGLADKVISSDGEEMDVQTDILRKFNNQYCPNLRGKPKFIIIQACRGNEEEYGFLPPTSQYGGSCTSLTDVNSVLPGSSHTELSWEDMVIAWSTLPGYVANRDIYRGTWFIESICKIFMEHAATLPLRDMLDEVAKDLKNNYSSERGTKQSFSCETRHFYKKLYFNPGQYLELDSADNRRDSTNTVVPEEEGSQESLTESLSRYDTIKRKPKKPGFFKKLKKRLFKK